MVVIGWIYFFSPLSTKFSTAYQAPIKQKLIDYQYLNFKNYLFINHPSST